MVVTNLLFVLFSGFSPTLKDIEEMGSVAQALAWISYARWLNEGLYTAHSLELSDSCKMPVGWYAEPSQQIAVFGLRRMHYSELFTGNEDQVTDGTSIWKLNAGLNVLVGIGVRGLAFVAMCLGHRNKMGRPSLKQLFVCCVINPVHDMYLRARS